MSNEHLNFSNINLNFSNRCLISWTMGKKSKPTDDVDSRAALLNAAKRVFAELGFAGATVKDLADAAGVNVSLVSYYFDGKENLYKECLETVGRGHFASAQKVLKAP